MRASGGGRGGGGGRGVCGLLPKTLTLFKGDRLQINVASEHILISQLFVSRMPKMCAIPQLVSAPLNPIPIAEHFRRSHPQCERSY